MGKYTHQVNKQYDYGEDIEIQFRKASISRDKNKIKRFKCGNDQIDKCLYECFDQSFSTTRVFVDKQDYSIIGYTTLSCSGIVTIKEHTHLTQPAIEIKSFAIDQRLHGLHYFRSYPDELFNLSDMLLLAVMDHCSNLSARIGFRYITLYAVKDAISLYTRQGFKPFSEFMEPDTHLWIDGCIPMYIEIDKI